MDWESLRSLHTRPPVSLSSDLSSGETPNTVTRVGVLGVPVLRRRATKCPDLPPAWSATRYLMSPPQTISAWTLGSTAVSLTSGPTTTPGVRVPMLWLGSILSTFTMAAGLTSQDGTVRNTFRPGRAPPPAPGPAGLERGARPTGSLRSPSSGRSRRSRRSPPHHPHHHQ